MQDRMFDVHTDAYLAAWNERLLVDYLDGAAEQFPDRGSRAGHHASRPGSQAGNGECACSGQDAQEHRFAFERIFPRLARVRTAEEVLKALA